MLCDICKQNVATVHLTQMVEGKTKKVDLCEACSKEKGVDDPTGFSLADLLLGLGAAQEMAQAAAGSDLKCPACGFTQADFKKTGRLGLPGKTQPAPKAVGEGYRRRGFRAGRAFARRDQANARKVRQPDYRLKP